MLLLSALFQSFFPCWFVLLLCLSVPHSFFCVHATVGDAIALAAGGRGDGLASAGVATASSSFCVSCPMPGNICGHSRLELFMLLCIPCLLSLDTMLLSGL